MTAMRNVIIIAVVLLVLAAIFSLYSFRRAPMGGGLLVDKRFEELVTGLQPGLSITVEALESNGRFLVEYTCDGGDKAPRIHVSNIPEGVKAIALILYDPDAPRGTFIHWLVVLPIYESGEIVIPSTDMVEGLNDFRQIGYGGPCPPRGDKAHRYFFLVLALDSYPTLKEGFGLEELLNSVRGHIYTYGYTVGTYER